MTQSRKTDHALGLIDWRMLPELGFRTISYDARGHGASTGNPEPDAYSWDALAEEDLMALVDHFSPHQPVRAIGISMGTATILTAMTLAPERFTAVTLGAPPTAWETRAPQGAVRTVRINRRIVHAVEFAAALTQAPLPPIFAEIPDYPRSQIAPHGVLPAILRGAGRSDLPTADKLAAVNTPSLVLAWDTDPVST